MIRVVAFDIGETLVDETRMWGEWADWLGIPRLTYFAALGTVIERREHHRRADELLRPGFDFEAERRRRGPVTYIEASDLYPDALPCLARLRAAGLCIVVAGNWPRAAMDQLRAAGVTADVFGSSAEWGAEKPSPAFFARLVAAAGAAPGEIAHVGDRVDNDVLPALAAGMMAVFLRRGPWGVVQATWPEAARAHLRLESLDALPAALALR